MFIKNSLTSCRSDMCIDSVSSSDLKNQWDKFSNFQEMLITRGLVNIIGQGHLSKVKFIPIIGVPRGYSNMTISTFFIGGIQRYQLFLFHELGKTNAISVFKCFKSIKKQNVTPPKFIIYIQNNFQKLKIPKRPPWPKK